MSNDINAIIAAAVAKALAGSKKPTRKSNKPAKRTEKRTEAEIAVLKEQGTANTIAAFTAKGFSDVKPRENVMTYGKWQESGRMVKKGEKAVRVGPFNLFHIDQTEAVSVAA